MEFDEHVHIASLRDSITCADGPIRYSYSRYDNIADHMRMLRQEFVGQPQLLLYHAWLIVRIRRNEKGAVPAFYDLWSMEGPFLLERLDSRWLVSACDTILDTSSDRLERALAIAGSLFIATIKLYETEVRATEAARETNLSDYRQEAGRVALMDGLAAFHIGYGDLLLNLTKRLDNAAGKDSIAGSILRELYRRMHRNDTVFKRFLDVHVNEQTRWFP